MPKKLLLVDDDISFLEELKETLCDNGYDPVIACDLSTVVKLAEETNPALILLDMKMNRKSGFQIADDLKHFPATNKIPILAMTGFYKEKLHQALMKSIGIEGYIIKPFYPADIIHKIECLTKSK